MNNTLKKIIFGAVSAALVLGLSIQHKPDTDHHATQASSAQTFTKLNDAAKMRIIENYGKTPMGFEENKGQSDAAVKYMTRGQGYSLFLTPTEAVLALSRQSVRSDTKQIGTQNPVKSTVQTGESRVLRMRMVGANSNPAITGLAMQSGKSNYIRGNDKKQWKTGINRYSRVRYHEVYEGIDLAFYGNQQQLAVCRTCVICS